MLNKVYVNLNVLKANARKIKSKLNKGVLFNAVVKADGYGHGGEKVANALYNICDSFSVAIPEEGIKLRLSGIDKDILVLTPILPADTENVVYYNLIPTIDNEKILYYLEKECKKQKKFIGVHIKFNTGMNRSGVNSLHQLDNLIRRIIRSEWIRLQGMYSHFPEPENKISLKTCENKFLLAKRVVKGYNKKAICHISASGGFLQGIQHDMVRIGILLYGYKPFASDYISVRPVMKVVAPIVEKRLIKCGESALYGLKKAKTEEKLTIVRYGYADGLERKEISSQFNNRCMDVTALRNAKTFKGNAVIISDADKIAKEYNTISYEILTKSALRAEKIYLN